VGTLATTDAEMKPSDERRLIDEQIDYYRRRAPEYDRPSTPLADFLAQGEQLREALHAFAPSGNVLEELDDVQEFYANFDISDEVLASIAG
jgi:hypothetical protein